MSLLHVTLLAIIPLVKGNNGCLCNLFASPEDRVTQLGTIGVDSLGVSLYDKKRTCAKTPSQLGAAPGTPKNKYKVHYRPLGAVALEEGLWDVSGTLVKRGSKGAGCDDLVGRLELNSTPEGVSVPSTSLRLYR